jgi:MFS transporter, ACS family, tartrate transporter
MGYIKDTTNTYDYALLLVAAALMSGGALGLYIGPLTARAKQTATPST